MESIQSKIKKLEEGVSIESLMDVKNSLTNIQTCEGRIIIANRHVMSSLLVTSKKEVDMDVPIASYIIAVPDSKYLPYLGKEIIIDMSYGGKGVSINTKIKNNDFKFIDVLGGMDNLKFSAGEPVLTDRTKMKLVDGNKIEFWDINLISLNQLGGIVYNG